jgi:hypothetical protein
MLDLGLKNFKQKIIKEEEWIWKHFGSDTKNHDIISALLFLMLGIKMYIQGDLKPLLASIKEQSLALGRTMILVCVLLVIFKENETINLTVQHALFAIFFHMMTHTHNIANIFWFTLIAMYYFNSAAAEE